MLGLWAGNGGGETAKFWMSVLAELKNRGVADVFFVVCDGLKGLPDSVEAVFPLAVVQTCIIHLVRLVVGEDLRETEQFGGGAALHDQVPAAHSGADDDGLLAYPMAAVGSERT